MARLPWPRDVREEAVALVPVPLASERQRRRGYNQSAVLAHALARTLAPAWKLEVWEDVIERTRSTDHADAIDTGSAFAQRCARLPGRVAGAVDIVRRPCHLGG